MQKEFFVYILASKPYGTLYVGVTANLIQRVWQHKEKIVAGFTKRYGVDKLVYFEACADAYSAFAREKTLKKWQRQWKIELIKAMNPQWRDLYYDIV